MERTMTDRMEKWLAEVDTAIKSQKEKDNTFTACILEEAKEIIQHHHATAYDLDKVVEALVDTFYEYCDTTMTEDDFEAVVSVIVKKGGVG